MTSDKVEKLKIDENRLRRNIAIALCRQAGEDPECIEFETRGGRSYAKWENYIPKANSVLPIVVRELKLALAAPENDVPKPSLTI